MPAAELIVWLIPGYLTLLLYLNAYPLRTRQSYEWFFQAGGLGILCFLLSRLVVSLIEITVPALPSVFGWRLSSDVARTWWHGHLPFTYSFSLVIGVAVSPVIAVILAALRPRWERLKALVRKVAPESPSSDILYFACRQMEGQLVIVTVDGGKVYVGFLVDYTSDPDEPEKYLKLVPLMSGRRKSDEAYVEFTTPYFTTTRLPSDEELARLTRTRAILIPLRKVVTLAPFDRELHQWFVDHDMVKISFKLDDPGEAEEAS
ncbi:MAG TPA: DUF6338 family protein [Thermoanaerobaculia bacterium]|nr:DUF6338 family protein [Thermoanaerobaculia bacterium]